jgi:hypothetical protein
VNNYLWKEAAGAICGGTNNIVYGFMNGAGTGQDHCFAFNPTIGTSYHLQVVYNGATIKLYKNGVEVDSSWTPPPGWVEASMSCAT